MSLPGVLAGQEAGDQGRQGAELVAPVVMQDPEIPSSFGLMVSAGGAAGFEPGEFVRGGDDLPDHRGPLSSLATAFHTGLELLPRPPAAR